MQSKSSQFFQQFLRNPRTIGAILPSSSQLAELMLEPVDFSSLGTIVEFGPGTGAVTRQIRPRLAPGQDYIGFETNEQFHAMLSNSFPGLTFVHESAAHLGAVLARHGVATVDAIICGLPWASLPVRVQSDIIDQVLAHLRPGGVFVTFGYLQGLVLPGARALRQTLKRQFPVVETTHIAWRNIPPAFAYVCRK